MHESRRCLTFFTGVYLTLCSYHVTRVFQSESTLYSYLNLLPALTDVVSSWVFVFELWLWFGIALQSLRFIFDHIFGLKKDNHFCPVFVYHRGMSNGISDFILYFKNVGLNISWISQCNSILVLKNGIQNSVF